MAPGSSPKRKQGCRSQKSGRIAAKQCGPGEAGESCTPPFTAVITTYPKLHKTKPDKNPSVDRRRRHKVPPQLGAIEK